MRGSWTSRSISTGAALALALVPMPAVAQDAAPCEASPRLELGFWIGDWEVLDPEGRIVGQSRIEFVLDGCAVREEWRSGEFVGVSLNAYDAPSREWRQLWVDNAGAVLRLAGTAREDGFVYEGERLGSDGRLRMLRVHLSVGEDGHPHQIQERSEDGGHTWSTTFEGHYRPRHPSG